MQDNTQNGKQPAADVTSPSEKLEDENQQHHRSEDDEVVTATKERTGKKHVRATTRFKIAWKNTTPTNKVQFGLSLAICVATIAYAVVASLQWSAMQGQLKQMVESNGISRDSFYATQRPYVEYQSVAQAVVQLKEQRTSRAVKVFDISASWQNVGNTPAVNVLTAIGVADHQQAEPTEDAFLASTRQDVGPTAAIGPKMPLSSTSIYKPLSFASNDGTQDQRYISGWTYYRDTFPDSKPHISEFCVHITAVGKQPGTDNYQFTATFCRQHNCVDEFCEDYRAAIQQIESAHGQTKRTN